MLEIILIIPNFLFQKTPLISMEVSHSQPQTAKNGSYHEPVLPVVKKAPMPIKTKPPNPTTPAQSMRNKNVNFSSNGEDEKKREKYLTAKYGAHQMALIRKRLKVEMWIFDQLQELYETEVDIINKIVYLSIQTTHQYSNVQVYHHIF